MIDLLKKDGNFYKANLHCHTKFSDGQMTPEEVKEHYLKNGYNIVAFTDHCIYKWHKQLESENFLPLAGVEVAFTCLDPDIEKLKFKLCHLNFIARDPENAHYIPENHAYDVGAINRYITQMKKEDWICTLNHPGWSLQTSEEINALLNLDGFEIYNHGSEKIYNNGDSLSYYTRYINNGSSAYAVATDDNHVGYKKNGEFNKAYDDTLGGFIYISMPHLSYDDFYTAFKNGSFYPSTGAQFKELYIDEEKDELVIECSPVKNVTVKGIHTVLADKILSDKDDITTARFPLAPIREREPFFTVEIKTSDGRKAFSQPYYFEKR